jgi:hypothetical protein
MRSPKRFIDALRKTMSTRVAKSKHPNRIAIATIITFDFYPKYEVG